MSEELYEKAVALVREHNRASTAFLQRSLLIGYSVAAEIITRMVSEGVVTEPDMRGRREVLGGS